MPIAVLSVPVSDVDRALAFYTDTLGLVLIEDRPMGPDMRWVQLQPRDGGATVALTIWFETLKPRRAAGADARGSGCGCRIRSADGGGRHRQPGGGATLGGASRC